MHFGYNYKAIEGVGPRPPDGKLLIFSAACPVLDRRKKTNENLFRPDTNAACDLAEHSGESNLAAWTVQGLLMSCYYCRLYRRTRNNRHSRAINTNAMCVSAKRPWKSVTAA